MVSMDPYSTREESDDGREPERLQAGGIKTAANMALSISVALGMDASNASSSSGPINGSTSEQDLDRELPTVVANETNDLAPSPSMASNRFTQIHCYYSLGLTNVLSTRITL